MKRLNNGLQFPSLPRPGKNVDFRSTYWLGVDWSVPALLKCTPPPVSSGVYKIFNDEVMLYCGETKNLAGRLITHKANSNFTHAHVSYHNMVNAQSLHLNSSFLADKYSRKSTYYQLL
jgi:hypothetical protein